MISELGKQILECVLLNEEVVAGQHICHFCATSINTIRKEIPVLNDTLREHGCEIQAVTSQGYRLVLYDSKKANPYLISLLREIKRFSYLNLSEYSRAYYILRFLLSAYQTYSLDQLTEELFFSRSTILREIPRMQTILSNFHLTLENKRSSGLIITGSEFQKRMCLLYLEKAYRSLAPEEKAREDHFATALLLNIDPGLKEKIRAILDRHLLQEARLHITPLYKPKITTYILIARSRSFLSSEIHFSREQLSFAKDEMTYPFARSLYADMPGLIQAHVSEADILILSMMLQTYRSIAQPDEIPQKEYAACLEEANEAVSFILKRYHVEAMMDDQLRQALAFHLYTVRRSLLYNIPLDEEILAPSSGTGLFTTDLCVEFGKFFELKHHLRLSEVLILRTYYIFNRALNAHRYYPYPQRFCLSSIYGLNYAENMKQRIMEQEGYYIQSIDTRVLMQSPAVNKDRYDAMLTDASPAHSQGCAIPILPMDFIRSPSNFKEIDDFILQVTLKHALPVFPKENLIYTDCTDKDEVYAELFELVKAEITNKEDFLKDLPVRDYYANSERVHGIVLLSPYNYTLSRPVVYFLVNQKSFLWNTQACRYFIFYSMGDGSWPSIFNVTYLLKQFIHVSPEILEAAVGQGWQAVVDQVLQARVTY